MKEQIEKPVERPLPKTTKDFYAEIQRILRSK
jgi:hypothetical protein